MQILIIGGTIFLGRHLVDAARARGHSLTLFNRGQHHPDLFPEIEKLRGDRGGDLGALDGRRWDACVDTCGYVPRTVRATAERLSGAVGHYTIISSISVYADADVLNIDESAPVGRLDDPTVETVDGQTYGPLKALCEEAAEAAMPGRVLGVRPGLIVGPHDPSDRFTYWPLRVARGGAFAAPAGPDFPVQVIDARDLAEWIVRMIEAGGTGVYNATGPDYRLTMGEVLTTCHKVVEQDAAGGDAENPALPVWIGEDVLEAHQVGAYVEMPLWIPAASGGLAAVDIGKAVGSGLAFRPLIDTVRDTLTWARARPADYALRAGLSAEREAALLAAAGVGSG
jgi:2'-hydroxyisoflavone reductase